MRVLLALFILHSSLVTAQSNSFNEAAQALKNETSSLTKGMCVSFRGGTKECNTSVEEVTLTSVSIVNNSTTTFAPYAGGNVKKEKEVISFALENLSPGKGGFELKQTNCDEYRGNFHRYHNFCVTISASNMAFLRKVDSETPEFLDKFYIIFQTEAGAARFSQTFMKLMHAVYPDTVSEAVCPELKGIYTKCSSQSGAYGFLYSADIAQSIADGVPTYRVILSDGENFSKDVLTVDGVTIPAETDNYTATRAISCEGNGLIVLDSYKINNRKAETKVIYSRKGRDLVIDITDPRMGKDVVTCINRY